MFCSLRNVCIVGAVLSLLAVAVPAQGLERRPMSCGAACVSLILKYYGQSHQEEDAVLKLEALGTRPEASFYELRDALEAAGLHVRSLRGGYGDIAGRREPTILHFSLADGIGHFVVAMYDLEKGLFRIFDPAVGTTTDMDSSKLQKFWTGAGLMVDVSPHTAGVGLTVMISAAVFVGLVVVLMAIGRRSAYRIPPQGIAPILALAMFMRPASIYADQQPVQVKADLGRVSADYPIINAKFVWRNSTSVALVVDRVRTGCDCTVPETPTEPVAPGKDLIIPARIDAQKRDGNAGVALVVYFKDDLAPPVAFHGTFTKDSAPVVRPATVDMGGYLSSAQPFKEFEVSMVSATRGSGMTLPRNPKPRKGLVSVKQSDFREEQFRQPSSAEPSYRQTGIYRVTPSTGDLVGSWTDELELPVVVGGVERQVLIPIRGEVEQSFYVRPDRVVAILRDSEKLDIQLEIVARSPVEGGVSLLAKTYDNQIAVATKDVVQDNESGTVGVARLSAQPVEPKLDTIVQITVSDKGGSHTLRVPVKIIRITSDTDK